MVNTMFEYPIPHWSDFEYVIQSVATQLERSSSYWETLRERHVKTRTAFQFLVTAPQKMGEVFSEQDANECLAFAYLTYVARMKSESASSTSLISGWTKRDERDRLATEMISFSQSDRSVIVEGLFSIGASLLQHNISEALAKAENHLKEFRWLLGSVEGNPSRLLNKTHEMRTPGQLLKSIDHRLDSVKTKSTKLIYGLSKSEDARRKLEIQLRTQLAVQENALWWLMRMGQKDQRFLKPFINMWLASDITFHECLYKMYDILMQKPATPSIDREAVWMLGHQATVGAITDSIAELRSVLQSIVQLNPILLEDATTRHLLNSIERSK